MKSSSSAHPKGAASGPSSLNPPSTGAALVQTVSEDEPTEYFVAMVSQVPSLLERVRERVDANTGVYVENVQVHETCLVSSPGFGVLDSGCGKTIIGEQTLSEIPKVVVPSECPVSRRAL